MYKIYIVEDDPVISRTLADALAGWGYETRCAADFGAIMPDFAAFSPQLVLLDITLPFYNGFHWCAELRRVSKVPVIFISSASDNMNIVMAMNMGADDFIAKPFEMQVLVAKVQALLRRTYDFGGSSAFIEHKGAILNTSDASLSYNGAKLSLTKNEYKILQLLMENKGRIIPRDDIMERLWETDCYIDDNTLTVNMARLRKKLEENGLSGFISTRKGIGYIIE